MPLGTVIVLRRRRHPVGSVTRGMSLPGPGSHRVSVLPLAQYRCWVLRCRRGPFIGPLISVRLGISGDAGSLPCTRLVLPSTQPLHSLSWRYLRYGHDAARLRAWSVSFVGGDSEMFILRAPANRKVDHQRVPLKHMLAPCNELKLQVLMRPIPRNPIDHGGSRQRPRRQLRVLPR